MFYVDPQRSLRSSPHHPSQRTYQNFWNQAKPNIKKWYDDASMLYFANQTEMLNQGLDLDLDKMDLDTMVDGGGTALAVATQKDIT